MSLTQNDALLATKRRIRDRRSIAHTSSVTDGFMDRDNATTTILPSTSTEENGDIARSKAKRSRSLSLGPGGIEALKEDAGNKRKMPLAPRSILKPTVKLSPLKQIPTRKTPEPTATLQSQSRSPRRNSPLKSPSKLSPSKNVNAGATRGPEAVKPKDVVNTEEQAKREKEEEVRKHREARRKSLAARRVSFAAEATLHTWEDIQDSTASTVSTEHTSKADSTIGQDSNSTRENPDEVLVSRSPAQKSKRRRRSSVIPPINFNNPDDELSSDSSSASSNSGDEAAPDMQSNEDDIVYSSSESDDDDTPEGVNNNNEILPIVHEALNVTRGELVGQQGSLQEPANVSPMQTASDGETGDISMDLASDDITAAFKPWAQRVAETARNIEEKVNPFSPAFKIATYPTLPSAPQEEDDDGMSMDMTKAIGGIMKSMSSLAQVQNAQISSTVRRSRRRSSASSMGGETMEFTTAIGGIQAISTRSPDRSFVDENEDLSMEFTSVFGGIQSRETRQPARILPRQPTSVADKGDIEMDGDGDMEMTTALGGILRSASELQTIDEDDEMNMDETVAFGGIIQKPTTADPRHLEQPAKISDAVTKPQLRSASARKARLSVGATATGSPMIFDSPSTKSRESMKNNKQMSTPSKAIRTTTSMSTPISGKSKLGKSPSKRTTTPQKQMTPQGVRPTTPGKTPLSTSVTMRIASPKRLFQTELADGSNRSGPGFADFFKLTQIVTQPLLPNKRLSGIAGNPNGSGSPKLAALLDRRASIGDRADVFVAQAFTDRGVRFEDPRALYIQASKEREEDERRESGQFILVQEADAELEDRDSTSTLKERIESMTPKKNKLKGRKSLAPGGAKGLLGKRPLELDEEDEDGTPLAFKHRSMTPVKKVKLTGPPSKQETTGRQSSNARQTLGDVSANDRFTTPSLESPGKVQTATTPKSQGRFKNAEALQSARKPIPTLGQEAELDNAELNETPDAMENIQLQDFLNMTSIRFMELNTTKRRHTIAPGNGSNALTEEGEVDQDKLFEEAVVAGACTVPMLELFQHSCRELKKYISEGRDIVREIEVDTFEENPPLFQEYMSASPAERAIMDTQFKNMKTHARLTSKGMWYEWRMKLLEGLKIGLAQVSEGMAKDDEVLSAQEYHLENTLSPMLQRHEDLTNECMELQSKVDAVPEDEREELEAVREQLAAADADIEEKRERILEYQKQLQAMDIALESAAEVKEECTAVVKDSQKLCEEYRGWTASEVAVLKVKVTNMETATKWSIASASSSNLTMVYDQQLQLFFDVASFLPFAGSIAKPENAPISLTYVGDTADRHPLPLTTEKRFFLQLMRAHLQCLSQHQTDVKELLSFVSTGWSSALAVVDEIRQLNRTCITNCSILSDERLEVKAMMLLPELRTKVTIGFEVGAAAEAKGVKCRITPRVDVAYGEPFKSNKMAEFLREKVVKDVGTGSWARTFKDLKGRLLIRGKK